MTTYLFDLKYPIKLARRTLIWSFTAGGFWNKVTVKSSMTRESHPAVNSYTFWKSAWYLICTSHAQHGRNITMTTVLNHYSMQNVKIKASLVLYMYVKVVVLNRARKINHLKVCLTFYNISTIMRLLLNKIRCGVCLRD